jgi:hypothetical protein
MQTFGIAISPRKEGALLVTTRGMDKGIPARQATHRWPTAVQNTCSHWSKPLPRRRILGVIATIARTQAGVTGDCRLSIGTSRVSSTLPGHRGRRERHVYSSVHGCSRWTGAARDQHQPASSRAMATFAVNRRLCRASNCSHFRCSRVSGTPRRPGPSGRACHGWHLSRAGGGARQPRPAGGGRGCSRSW